ncbi:hypothetical protein QL285_045033 [Trifolium repens]|nr:hypothetical protein QL285_045033 [Trifolium repens]
MRDGICHHPFYTMVLLILQILSRCKSLSVFRADYSFQIHIFKIYSIFYQVPKITINPHDVTVHLGFPEWITGLSSIEKGNFVRRPSVFRIGIIVIVHVVVVVVAIVSFLSRHVFPS